MTRAGLTTLDWIVIVGYGVVMVLMGIYYARRQRSSQDFFVGGRSLNSTAVGISLLATLLSTISYLATPGEMIAKGPVIGLGVLGSPIVYFVVGYWLLPVIMRHQITSAYELLESKLGLGVRLLAASMFLALRLTWMGVMISVASVAVVGLLGLSDEQAEWAVPLTVFLCGFLAVGYTALGGLKAVVTTDVVQFILLFSGALLTIAMVTWESGGFSWFPTQWEPHWESQPIFSWDPTVRITWFGTILGGALYWVCTSGSDQTAIQRFMATGSQQAARRSFLVNIIADVLTMAMLALVGLAVLGFYRQQSGDTGIDLVGQGDQLFPRFIATQLPPGVAGLVVAAMFAAVMSSSDSGLNSSASVIITDFIRRFSGRQPTDAEGLRLSRNLTLAMGVVIVVLAMLVQHVPGNILEVSQRTLNLLVAPLFAIFFLAFFVRFATPFGAVFGTWYGCTVAFLISFWDAVTGGPSLSFQWIAPCALLVSIAVGVSLSLVPGQKSNRKSFCVLAGLPVAACNMWIVWQFAQKLIGSVSSG